MLSGEIAQVRLRNDNDGYVALLLYPSYGGLTLAGMSLRSFAYMDVGEGREQDAEALPALHDDYRRTGKAQRTRQGLFRNP